MQAIVKKLEIGEVLGMVPKSLFKYELMMIFVLIVLKACYFDSVDDLMLFTLLLFIFHSGFASSLTRKVL